jgi:hypothetical protein
MKKKSLIMTVVAILCFATISIAQTVPSYVPVNGLVGWWPFNGNANDESGNGNNGIPMNGAVLSTDRFASTNAAYSFDGVNGYIEILNSSSLNSSTQAITISTWFKINNWFNVNNWGWFPIMSKSNLSSSYGNYRSGLYLNATNLKGFYCTFNSGQIGDTVNLQLNTWNQIVYSIDDTNNLGKIYLNGILLKQGVTSYTGWSTTNTLPLILGLDNPGIADYANGSLDDIGIWSRALTQQEITDLYNCSTVSISEVSRSNLFSVYPNPTQHVINVKADAKLIGSIYTIYDNTGKIVLSGKINSENTVIDLGNLSGGIYSCRVGENLKQTFKVIKE